LLFFKLYALLLFQVTAKRNLDVFLCKLAHCELVFLFPSLLLCLIYVLVLVLLDFFTKRILGLFNC